MEYTEETKKVITETADEICRICNGLPLWKALEALRLANQRLEMMGVVHYAADIDGLTDR